MSIPQDKMVQLLLQRRSSVLGFITSIVGDVHLAEDVYQEVAVLATQKRRKIRDEEHLIGWLMHTARFMALNSARKHQSGRQVFNSQLLDSLEGAWTKDEEGGKEGMIGALRECIKQLTPRAQELVHLRYSEGLSGEALATKVKRKVHAVYVSLSRIHKSLAQCVERSQASSEG